MNEVFTLGITDDKPVLYKLPPLTKDNAMELTIAIQGLPWVHSARIREDEGYLEGVVTSRACIHVKIVGYRSYLIMEGFGTVVDTENLTFTIISKDAFELLNLPVLEFM